MKENINKSCVMFNQFVLLLVHLNQFHICNDVFTVIRSSFTLLLRESDEGAARARLGVSGCLPLEDVGISLSAFPSVLQKYCTDCFPPYPFNAKRQLGKLFDPTRI